MNRSHNRSNSEHRPVKFSRNVSQHAEGSALVQCGNTHVWCIASVEKGRPRWMRDQHDLRGWVTAEYGMLPRSTGSRMRREAAQGKQSGRTMEIQRLIARSLRAAIDLTKLGDYTITIDCDVIQADGGTRTAAITGGCIALYDAIQWLLAKEKLKESPFLGFVAAISAGIVNSEVMVDLDYQEDSNADTDMNVVMNHQGKFIEIQGTAEGSPFSDEAFQQLLSHSSASIHQLLTSQQTMVDKDLTQLTC